MAKTASFYIRQLAALLSIGTFAWDVFRAPEVLQHLSLWVLVLHFLYFQLPLKSRAVPVFHGASFIGAHVIPVCYSFLLFCNPTLEKELMEAWDISAKTSVIRSVLIHFVPLFFHWLDITTNQQQLIQSYVSKSKKVQMLWSFASFFLLTLVYEFVVPDPTSTYNVKNMTNEEFVRYQKLFGVSMAAFAYVLLYMLVIRRAYNTEKTS